ncbi:MAG: glycosyltransferase family 39 protein [Thermodesulfovibrionales bacterium]
MKALADLDTHLFLLINGGLASSALDLVMPLITTRAYVLFVPLIAWILAKDLRRGCIAAALALLSLAFADAAAYVLKIAIGRPRPFAALEDVRLLVGRGGSSAMPSGHATNAFAVASAIGLLFPGMVRALLLIAAGLVALSRIYVGVHYPSDVLAGAVLGAGVAFMVVRTYWAVRDRYGRQDYRFIMLVAVVMLSLFRVYFILTERIDLNPDEAQYWDWSRRLDLSYYSKGPLIAYLIAAGTWLFGDNVFGVRVGAVVLSALGSIVLFGLARRMCDGKTALFAAVLFQLIPLYSVFGIIMTIDAPFTFFWILSLYLMWRIWEAVQAGQRTAALWTLLGVSAGIGLLAKYTMVLFFVCALLYVLTSKSLRGELKRRGPFIAVLIAFAVFSPVLIWNARNGWVTIRHAAGQAHVHEGFVLSVKDLLEFAGSQLGVVSPVILVLMVIALLRGKKEAAGRFALWFSAPVFVFFLAKSIQGKVQANWAMAAYVTGLIVLSGRYLAAFGSLRRRTRVAVVAGVVVAVLTTVVAHYPELAHLPPSKDPSRRMRGWKQLGQEISTRAGALSAKGDFFILSDRYQITSELAFYVEGNPSVYCADTGRRMNQYDLWPGFETLIGYNALYVTKERAMDERVARAFERCDAEEVEITVDGNKVNTFHIFECYNFSGLQRREPTSY